MPTLGGSLFVHDGIRFDYCFRESIASLCGICDEVVALDASSTDGTTNALLSLVDQFTNLRVITSADWECAPNFRRIAILANQAAGYLNCDWHFMLQADEVLHESSYRHIRYAINQIDKSSFLVRRLNLYGDLNHCIRLDIEQPRKPCSDAVIRLARSGFSAYGDGESLKVNPNGFDASTLLDKIVIVHYGMVRDDAKFIAKTINMQGWFYGDCGKPDQRVIGMQDAGKFDWEQIFSRDDLMPLPVSHPAASRSWAEERQRRKTPILLS